MIRRLLRGHRGFTLIELLVAVGILAILAGVAVPVVVKFTGSSQTKAAEAERAGLQSAVHGLMADKEIGIFTTASPVTGTADALIDTVGEATNNMSAFPYTDGDWDLISTGLVRGNTVGTYRISDTGLVIQVTTGY
jgi:prepilin-type N-terminal cleavage/methylation domain-containing protein